MVINMGIMGKIAFGFGMIIFLNYFMDFIVDQIEVDVAILGFDVSGFMKAVIVTVLNLVAFVCLKGLAGLEGAVPAG